MIVGLSATLANGVKVNTMTMVEKITMVRFMATHRLGNLAQQYPTQLEESAVKDPFKVTQDVTKLTGADFAPFLEVTVVFATPPCQPFSNAGATPG